MKVFNFNFEEKIMEKDIQIAERNLIISFERFLDGTDMCICSSNKDFRTIFIGASNENSFGIFSENFLRCFHRGEGHLWEKSHDFWNNLLNEIGA